MEAESLGHLFWSRLDQQVRNTHSRGLLHDFCSQTSTTCTFISKLCWEKDEYTSPLLRLHPDRFCAVTEISPGKGNTKGEKESGEKREWAHWLRERKGYPHLGKGRLYCQEHNLVITFRFRNERKEKITPKYKRRLCQIIWLALM